MERETKTITVPSGVEVVMKTYLTGREKRDISSSAMPTSIDYNTEDGVKGLNPQKIMEAQEDATLRAVIVSIDGRSEGDMVERVLSMRSSDSDCILAAAKEIVGGLTEEKKTT